MYCLPTGQRLDRSRHMLGLQLEMSAVVWVLESPCRPRPLASAEQERPRRAYDHVGYSEKRIRASAQNRWPRALSICIRAASSTFNPSRNCSRCAIYFSSPRETADVTTAAARDESSTSSDRKSCQNMDSTLCSGSPAIMRNARQCARVTSESINGSARSSSERNSEAGASRSKTSIDRN